MQQPCTASEFVLTYISGTYHAVNEMAGASLIVSWFGEYQLTNNPFSCIIPLDFQAAVYLSRTSSTIFVPSRISLYRIPISYLMSTGTILEKLYTSTHWKLVANHKNCIWLTTDSQPFFFFHFSQDSVL